MDAVYKWQFKYSLFRQYDWIRTYVVIFAITELLVMGLILIVSPSSIGDALWCGGLILGIYVL